MAKAKRNIGKEILDGLRELKRGKHARVVNVPDVGRIPGRSWPRRSAAKRSGCFVSVRASAEALLTGANGRRAVRRDFR